MIVKFFLAIKYLLSFYLFHNKKKNSQINIIVIDGPTAISVSNKLCLLTDKFSFFVPIQYIPLVIDSNINVANVIYPPLHTSLAVLISAVKDFFKKKEASFLTIISSKLICSFIENNHRIIDNLITYNERGFVPFSAILLSKSHAIRTCCIQHGAVVEKYFPVYVDIYFTWSDHFSNLIKLKCPTVETVNVGRLGYEPPMINKSHRHDFPLVILQPGNVSISYGLVLNDFVEIIRACLNIYNGVILRPHPNDNISKDLLVKFNNDNRICFDNDLLIESLSKRMVVISLYSTVLIEASLSGCIAIQYTNDNWYSPIFKRSNIIVHNSHSLEKLLKNIFEGIELQINSSEERLMSPPNYELFFQILEGA